MAGLINDRELIKLVLKLRAHLVIILADRGKLSAKFDLAGQISAILYTDRGDR